MGRGDAAQELVNFAATAVNTVADLVFVRFLNVEGLALGLAVAYTFAAIVAGLILRDRLRGLQERPLWPALARITLGGLHPLPVGGRLQ